MYRTIWKTEDGITHRAIVTGNATKGYEIRSDCGLIDSAAWASQQSEYAAITCPRCRSINSTSETQPPEPRMEPPTVEKGNRPQASDAKKVVFEGSHLIHVYSRKQAIADAVLVDVTPIAKEAGIRYPTALTRAVWDNFVRVPQGIIGQDEQGRLWDIVWLLRHAAKSSQGDTVNFDVYVRNDNEVAKKHMLKAICGPDDDGNPCITLLLPTED